MKTKIAKIAGERVRKSGDKALFELIANPKEFTARYADGKDGKYWINLWIDPHKSALALAELLADNSFPALMFGVNETESQYIVSFYTTQQQSDALMEVTGREWSGIDHVSEGCRVVLECGSNGIMRPCLGWWNI